MILRAGDRSAALPAGESRPVLSVTLPSSGTVRMASSVSFMPYQHFQMLDASPAGVPVYWTRRDDSTILFHPAADRDYEVVARDTGGILLQNPERVASNVADYVNSFAEQQAEMIARQENTWKPQRIERFDGRQGDDDQ